MADELEPVEQQFIADMDEYLADLETGAEEAQAFADANIEAAAAVADLRDDTAETGAEIVQLSASIDDAAASDEALTASATEAAEALGHLRDEALEASAALDEVRDKEVEAGAAGDAAGSGGISMMAGGIVALVAAASAVAPAVVAAGAGLGAFGLFAIPTIKEVTGALKDTQAQLDKLPQPIQTAVSQFKNLETEWKSISKTFQPEVLSLWGQAMGIASTAMAAFVPLAQQGAQAAQLIMNAIGRGIDSSGFSSFLQLVTSMVVPATNALIGLASTLIGILGNAFTQLAPISVPFINMLNNLLKAAGPGLVSALKFIAEAIMDIGKAITPALGPLGELLGYMADHSWVASFAAALVGLAAAAKLASGAMAIFDAITDANPVVLIIAAIALLVIGFIELWNHSAGFRDFWIGMWHDIKNAVDVAREGIIDAGHAIENATDAVRESFIRVGHDIEAAFDRVRHAVATAGHDIAHGFDEARHAAATAGHDIVAGLETAANWIQSHWKEIVAWLVDPIGMAVFEIRTHTHEIAQAFDTARHDISSIFDGIRHDAAALADDVPHLIAQGFDAARHDAAAAIDGARHDVASDWDSMRHDVASFADDVVHSIENGFDTARHDAAAAIDGARHDIASDYDSMRHDVASFADDVVSFFKSLPGKLVSALASLPGLLEAAGKNAIEGLINGIKDAAAAIPGIMKGLASDVESYFTDPLKMFSPSRVFYEHGVNTVQGYINGIKAATPAVRSAMASLGGSIAAGGITGTGSAVASASSVHVNVPITLGAGTQGYNNPAFLQYIQQTVQEATLRYTQVNPSNGLNLAGKLA